MNIMSDINNKYLKEIGQIILELRKEKNISQEELSELADIHRTYLSDIERGKRNLTVVVLRRVIDALHIKMSEFFEMVEKERFK
ncbi:TPA: helix-turn-helix transcriptional regulator [Staphylococcus aureus]|nr:helix-turn-helix transcriptional regulator [Staphylococcus aureus]